MCAKLEQQHSVRDSFSRIMSLIFFVILKEDIKNEDYKNASIYR